MRKLLGVGGAAAVAGGLLLASASPAQADVPVAGKVTICITVTPKSVSVTINDQSLSSPPVGQPTTCVVL